MSDVFPLPMAPFEQYMLEDDRPSHPMTIVLELELLGVVRRREFEEAIEVARSRHPMLRAHAQRRWLRRPRWVDAGHVRPFVHWGILDEPLDLPSGEHIDLTREVGVRFWVRVGAAANRVVVQFHHACVDANGAMIFLSDLFAHYAHLVGDPRPEFMPVELSKLGSRGDLKVTCGEPISAARFVMGAAWNALKLLFRTATPLAIPSDSPRCRTSPSPFPSTHTRTLAPRVFRGLRQIARDSQVTINDLLLRELYLTMKCWNRRHSRDRKRKWLVIVMPCNLRTAEHAAMPAANVMSYGFLLRHVRECHAPEKLLESIHRESLLIQRRSYPAIFTSILRFWGRLPGVLWLFNRVPRCATTAVLSYVGNPTRVITAQFPINAQGHALLGNLTLTGINAAPPVRAWTRASFSVWHFNHELRVSLHWDRHAFTSGHAQNLLDEFVARIEARGGIGSAAPAAPAAA